MEDIKYKFQPKQLFPINTNITTALTLQEDILTVTSTYPPTLSLFNIETYNIIYSRQLDYEIRKIEKIGDKLILLSDNYLEFHNTSRFIEKVQTKAIDFKFNPKDGRIYSVGSKGIEIIDFTKNIKLINKDFNRNDQFLKIDILEFGYVINNRFEEINNLRSSIDIYDFRTSVPNVITFKGTEDVINSMTIKDPLRFYSLSEGYVTEHDLRSTSVVKYPLNQYPLNPEGCSLNLKEYPLNIKGLRNLKCLEGGLMFNNKNKVFYLDLSSLTSSYSVNTNTINYNTINKDIVCIAETSNEGLEDYVLKDGYLYLGGSAGVQIFHNEYFSLSKSL